MLTLDELRAKILLQYDPDEVLELLEITTENLLDAFEFRLAEQYDKLNKELCDE